MKTTNHLFSLNETDPSNIEGKTPYKSKHIEMMLQWIE